MNINELRQAQADYFVEETIERRKDLHTIRARFTRDFSVKQITEMSIDDYIIGKNIKTTFCYRIERELDMLGRIKGATAYKFGVFYNKGEGIYKQTKIWGNNHKDAFLNIRSALIELINAGEKKILIPL